MEPVNQCIKNVALGKDMLTKYLTTVDDVVAMDIIQTVIELLETTLVQLTTQSST